MPLNPQPQVTLPASQVPGAQILPAYVSLASVYALAAAPAAAIRTVPGISAGFVAQLNQNAHAHDYLARYGAGPGIGAGLGLSASYGGNNTTLTLQIAAGQAIIDGLVELSVNTLRALTDNLQNLSPYGRASIWLQQGTGGNTCNVVVVNNSITPPAGNPSIYLGAAVTHNGDIVSLDVSGVFYKRGGLLWRQTADGDIPTDIPPAGIAFLTRTLGGLWLYDGYGYSRLGDALLGANNQTGTSYSLALTDIGRVVELNNAATVTVTIPPVASVNWPVGAELRLYQQGAGQVVVSPGAGVTLRSDGAKYKIAGQYGVAYLRMRASNEWVLSGDISA